MGLFYTGKGDGGKSFVGRKKFDKASPAMEALGALDELNSLLGLVRSEECNRTHKARIRAAQEALFIIQANVAAPLFKSTYKAPVLSPSKLFELEEVIRRAEHIVRPGRGFIVSGEHSLAAWYDYSRAVSRRAERAALRVAKKLRLNPLLLAYLNRLSSFLFALARLSAKKSRVKELHPTYR